jgi:hypothetical protein
MTGYVVLRGQCNGVLLPKKMTKMQSVKPAVDQICNVGSVERQASALCAVIDHCDLAAARELAGINSTKEMAAAKYLCEQSAQMLGCACKSKKA